MSEVSKELAQKIADEIREKLIEKYITVLNEAYDADPAAIHALLLNRIPCNEKLANHPTIQVTEETVPKQTYYSVGVLGLLNGLIASATGTCVAAKFSEPDKEGRATLLGFQKYNG